MLAKLRLQNCSHKTHIILFFIRPWAHIRATRTWSSFSCPFMKKLLCVHFILGISSCPTSFVTRMCYDEPVHVVWELDFSQENGMATGNIRKTFGNSLLLVMTKAPEGNWPMEFRGSIYVLPIYKKGDKMDCNNHRTNYAGARSTGR